MGPNHSDVQSMVLLPELLYRHAFGEPLLALPGEWTAAPASLPILDGELGWDRANRAWVSEPEAARPSPQPASRLRSLARRLPRPVKDVLRKMRPAEPRGENGGPTHRLGLEWQPAFRYQRHWPKMPAFALPSFYDGRIRINLKGRERDGIVEPTRYEETRRELEALLLECRNPRTGEPMVEAFERASTRDPLALTSSEADLLVIWRGVAAALEHPRLGVIGPVPLRRTGGHTGPHGLAYVASPDVEPGDRGVRSSFDVVPTIARLMAAQPPARVSGTSLV
jgi:hypothetical protein